MNIIKGNGKGGPVTIAGGGIYRCQDVRRNFIYDNHANNGAGICFGGYFEDTSNAFVWGTVQGNIIAENVAESQGGGIYTPSGRIENNTIYGNTAGSGVAGVYLEAGLPSANTGDPLHVDNFVFQNNIVWANDWLGTVQSNEQYSTTLDDHVRNCAVQVTTAPSANFSPAHIVPNTTTEYYHDTNFNIGPFTGRSMHGDASFTSAFISTTLSVSTLNYDEYLHLDSAHPAIDRGSPYRVNYDDSSFSGAGTTGNYVQRDFDDQLSYIDDASSLNSIVDTQQESNPIFSDIGADEYPTNTEGFSYWWLVVAGLE